MNRRLRTALDWLNPDIHADMQQKQEGTAQQSQGTLHLFCPQDLVHMRNDVARPNWIPATIVEVAGHG